MTKRRSPSLAALASFTLPGLGQLYNGQPWMALAWFVGYMGLGLYYTYKVFGAVAAAAPGTPPVMPTNLFLGMCVVWLGGVVQAVLAALGRQDYELRPYNHGLVYFLAYPFAYGMVPVIAAFFFRPYLVRLRDAGQLPDSAAVASGLQGWLRRASQPKVGEPVDLRVEIVDPEAAAATANTVFHVVLVGGPDGGIYDAATDEVVCTERKDPSAPSWAGLYANPRDTAGLTAVQFRVPIAQGETNDFQLSVNRGNGESTRTYLVDGRRPWGEDGRGRATVERRGEGAIIRVDATTEKGVRLEVVVQCRKTG